MSVWGFGGSDEQDDNKQSAEEENFGPFFDELGEHGIGGVGVRHCAGRRDALRRE